MSKKSTGQFIGGLIVGGAIGTVVGLLVAPRSGRDTRRILKKSADALPELAEDLSSTVQMQAYRLSESASQNWDETLMRLKAAIAAGVDASQLKAEELSQPRNVTADSTPSSSD